MLKLCKLFKFIFLIPKGWNTPIVSPIHQQYNFITPNKTTGNGYKYI